MPMIIKGEDQRLIFLKHDLFSEKDVSLMNVLQTAYIGDTVWELIVRNHLIRKKLNVHHMHSECIQYVSAWAQASFMSMILPELNSEEADLVRRGRNAHAHHPVPKNQNPEDYSLATAFETLLGYLYLTGKEERIEYFSNIIIGGNERG